MRDHVTGGSCCAAGELLRSCRELLRSCDWLTAQPISGQQFSLTGGRGVAYDSLGKGVVAYGGPGKGGVASFRSGDQPAISYYCCYSFIHLSCPENLAYYPFRFGSGNKMT
jgi:hypothetical protein